MDSDGYNSIKQTFGVYTKTVVRSPVVRWILNARIRHRDRKDVVFVGEDFVEIKQIGVYGELQHIASKCDFDARIRNAKVFDTEDDRQDFLVKLERDRNPDSATEYPPQLLALTLDSNDLVFIYTCTDQNDVPHFIQQSCPMPSFDRILFQPGEHLAVDPYSRALAVAANEREVILYSAKRKERLQHEIDVRSGSRCPISAQRSCQVAGVIHHIDFLIPTADDEDNVMLLLVVTDHRRTKIILIDWHYSLGLMHAEQHAAQPLSTQLSVPNLLIPLRDTRFLLVTGDEIVLYKGILTGSCTGFELPSPDKRPQYPGNSSVPPIWASWTKPQRTRNALRENIYLVREDGPVYLFQIDIRNTVITSHAGELACHVGTAFASLGDEEDPDILAVAGETSSGSVVSIGLWQELNREDAMSFSLVHIIPNWASVTDMIGCRRIQSSRALTHTSDALLVTSGRQPFGCITDLRNGLEARLAQTISLELLRYTTNVWALPNKFTDSIILLLSMLDGCKLIELASDLSEVDVGDIDSVSVLETTRQTLLVGVTASSQIVQVTRDGIWTSTSLRANLEGTSKLEMNGGISVIAAALAPECSVLITAERHETSHRVCSYKLSSPEAGAAIQLQSSCTVSGVPLCIAAKPYSDGVLALVATEAGYGIPIAFRSCGETMTMPEKQISHGGADSAVCDNIVILGVAEEFNLTPGLLALCGLRDGKLITFEIDPGRRDGLINQRETELGFSSVKLIPLPSDPSSVIATTGSQACLVRWYGGSSESLEIHNIWVLDKQRPDYTHGPIVAATQLPSAAYLASDISADALVLISGDEMLITKIEPTPTTVARQMSVSGSPNRLIHSKSLRSLVSSALCTDIRMLQPRPHSTPIERRQIWPVIDFLPDRGGESFSYSMQPGERVNALLEWTYCPGDEKTYSHILVGGSYVRRNGARRGRVTFLQPSNNKNWEIVNVTERSKDTFDEDNVYALALFDSVTYIACAGGNVYVKRYEQKWHELCPAFKLASPGVRITVETDHSGQRVIAISTMRDSLITLRLVELSLDEQTSVHKFELRPVTTGPRAETLLHHLVLDTTSAPYQNNDIDQFTLMTTKYGQVLGMISPKTSHPSHSRPGQLVFEAQLPRSLIRLTRTPSLPRKGPAPPGVVPEYITGCTSDGSLIGIVLLECHLWRRLCWLQRLIEWSQELSPHSFAAAAYSVGDIDSFSGRDRALPIGFVGTTGDLAVLQTNNDKLQDFHVDGDVLARVLQPEGKEAVKGVLRLLASRDNATGVWVKEHMDEECGNLDELVDVVAKLDAWM